MMDRFGLYAKYYNLLYRDKDYAGEAAYVDDIIKKYLPNAHSLLNLGSGTGRHDYELARLGYKVTGVDLSEQMIAQAKANSPDDLKNNLEFLHGDIRTFKADSKFDVVTSLFHVMSYQVDNADMKAVINSVSEQLQPGGLFVFDCWYGPGVLTDPPVLRVKQMRDEHISVTRTAEPVIHSLTNVVDVNFTIRIGENNTNEQSEIKELHRMRYFFQPEIELMTEGKFTLLQTYEWLTNEKPTLNSWNAVFVLQKI